MRTRGPGLAALAAIATLALVAPSLPAWAADPGGGEIDLEELAAERERRAKLYPVSRRVSRYLDAAIEEVDEEKPEEAKRLLQRLDPDRLNPYERALVYRMLAFVAYGADEPEEAIRYFEKVLAEEILPLRDDSRIRFNIAQLYAGLQRWQDVIDALDRWLRYTANPDPLGYYLKGIAYYQLDDYDAAIENAERAIDLSAEPKESWLRLLAALFSEKQDYASAIPVLEELLLRYPKEQYWEQLALIYAVREDYRVSLAVQQVAYEQGFLTKEKELLRLARSYLFNDLPYPAAKVLEKGLEEGTIERDPETLVLLANSWIAAREYDRSLPPLREAARLADDGNLHVRLGQVYMQREKWSEAAEHIRKALEKGGLDDRGNAELLLGIAYYNDQRVDRARSSFARARQYDSSRQEADRWITHLETESRKG